MSRLWDFIQIAPLRVRIPDIVCLQVQPEVYAKGKLSPLGSGLVRSEWKHGVEEPRVTALIAKEEHLSPLHARSDTRACDATLTIRDQRVRGTIRLDYLSPPFSSVISIPLKIFMDTPHSFTLPPSQRVLPPDGPRRRGSRCRVRGKSGVSTHIDLCMAHARELDDVVVV